MPSQAEGKASMQPGAGPHGTLEKQQGVHLGDEVENESVGF